MNVAAFASLIAFASTLGAAVIASYVGPRLPSHHSGKDTQEIVKLTTAMLATLTALVVGLLIGGVRASYESKDADLKRVAAQIVALDRTLVQYGAEARDSRVLLRQIVKTRLHEIWTGAGQIDTGAVSRGTAFEGLQEKLLQLVPRNEAQKWLQGKALQLTADIMEVRWLLAQKLVGTVPWPVLIILVFWLAAIFFSFGLFAPRNGTALGAFIVAALSIAGAIFLMLALDQPYGGPLGLASDPFRSALDELMRSPVQ